MLRIFSIVAPALAVNCGLPEYIDPAPYLCHESSDGWANINVDAVDSVGAPNLTIAVITNNYTDSERGFHYPHPGSIDDSELVSNGRYLLSCPDTSGNKTLKLTVTRHRNLTKFQGEWLKLFPKDSWEEVTSAFEPYTINDWGSKVPLAEYRPDVVFDSQADTSKTLTDALNVYMSVPATGDFEVKFGSPYLKNDCPEDGCNPDADWSGKWIALEFKGTLLRVGNPWGACGASADYGSVGAIVPLYLGHPYLERASYAAAADVIKAHTDIPIQVVVQLYTPSSGNVNATNGALPNAEKWTPGTPAADGSSYTMCYAAGTPCPDSHSVCSAENCELARFNQIIASLRTNSNVKVLSYVETVDAFGDARSYADMAADAQAAKDAVVPALDGFYFGGVSSLESAGVFRSSTEAMNTTLAVSAALKAAVSSTITVIGTGGALMDPYVLEGPGAPDTVVTLSADFADRGSWNPFAWYPARAPTTWGAVVTNVAEGQLGSLADVLFDRGYGFVFLHAGEYTTVSTHLDTMLTRIKTQSTPAGRRLAAAPRQLQEAATLEWGCDETLFECTPICLKTTGLVTVKVADTECAGEPLDQCKCSCMYNAVWTCDAESEVVCKATGTFQLETTVVGDLVCASRGTPKPVIGDFTQRQASSCEEKPVARGSYPTQTCLAQFQQAKEDRAAAKRALTTTTEAPTVAATEAPTEAATEAPTETTEAPTTAEGTEAPTEAPTTEAPTTEEATTTAEPTLNALGMDIMSFAPASALALLALSLL